jgi:general secretion pathway protein A
MMSKLRELYGLTYNPFTPDVPIEALLLTPRIRDFLWRIEHGVCGEGGFAMITGAPGVGKSVIGRLTARHLESLRDVMVVPLQKPQSGVADFYRELGELFGVPLRPHNRWAGFKELRSRFCAHIETATTRAVLIIDEAQECNHVVLSELRLLASTRFDSRWILGVILIGDDRLPERLRREELVPLGSRLRTRLQLAPHTPAELAECLTHRMRTAGNAALMTPSLVQTLSEHALGNPRVLLNTAGELLHAAAQRDLAQLDDKLYLEVCAQAEATPRRAAGGRRR